MKSVRQPFTFDRVIRILFTVVAIVAVFYLIGLLKNALSRGCWLILSILLSSSFSIGVG